MQKKWTGRVIKHLPCGQVNTPAYGTEENLSLLTDYYSPLTVIADEQDAGKTIRDVLVRHFAVSSKLLAQARLTDYGLTINEERVYISAPVEQGEAVRLRMLRESSDDIAPEEMPLHILYEDEALLILNKPPGIVVHPTHGHYTGTLANGVVHYWRGKGERVRFRPIHRLDEDTSGIVVIAKNAYVHQQLSEQMQAGKMDKNYVAYVYGQVDKAEQLIDAPIDRDPAQPHMRTVIQTGYASQTIVKAVKYYRYVHNGTNEVTNATLVQLKLLTGRTHQIRVHMHYIGHPLIGDQMYKAPDKYMLELPMSRQALHANKLTFIHPMTRVRMTIEAPFPEDFKQLESRLQEEFL